MKLEITKEKVLEAASKCSTAKATLQTLFPECFDTEKSIVLKDLADLLNGTSTSSALYNAIPGKYSIDKAKTLHSLIVSTYLNK